MAYKMNSFPNIHFCAKITNESWQKDCQKRVVGPFKIEIKMIEKREKTKRGWKGVILIVVLVLVFLSGIAMLVAW